MCAFVNIVFPVLTCVDVSVNVLSGCLVLSDLCCGLGSGPQSGVSSPSGLTHGLGTLTHQAKIRLQYGVH